jgi:hypothetical protein
MNRAPLTFAPAQLLMLVAPLGQVRDLTACLNRALQAFTAGLVPALFLVRTTREEIYNALWALVFAFATLNILSLGAKRFDPNRSGLTFGEVLAILVVVVSLILLGWEMLYLFHILPIQLAPR